MLNYIWLSLVILAVVLGGLTGCLEEMVKGGFDMAKTAVMDIALPLSAIMTIWLGVMRLADKSGIVLLIARGLKPLLKRLFPDVPGDHPAMGAMVMNIAANMLGLGNAATPLGLRAMSELQKLNPHPGVATNAMCTFLAINTASIQLIPATAVGILAVNGGRNPTAIIGTAFLATVCAQVAGLTAVKFLQRLPIFGVSGEATSSAEAVSKTESQPAPPPASTPPPGQMPVWGKVVLAGFLLLFAILLLGMMFPQLGIGSAPQNADLSLFSRTVKALSLLAIPFFLSFFPLYAALRGLKVYEEFVEGAKEGFAVAVRIIPYLVTMLAAVGMFRGAHGIEWISHALKPVLVACQFPPELLSLAIMRPLSGSGSIALVSDIVKTYGPDHIFSLTAGTILGSTETTFYVLAVYFGSVGIRRTRHAVAAGLIADLVGIVASVVICRLVLCR